MDSDVQGDLQAEFGVRARGWFVSAMARKDVVAFLATDRQREGLLAAP